MMKHPFRAPGHNQFAQKPDLSSDQASVADQDTAPLVAVRGSPPAVSHKARSNTQEAIQLMIGAGLARLQEPQPEGLLTRGLQVVKPGARLGAFPVLTLTNAFGLLVMSFSYYLSISQYS